MTNSSPNIVWHKQSVTRLQRQIQNNHRSAIIWFTGLSGSGKSTLAHAVEQKLHSMGCRTVVLDGDNIRHGLCGDLTFSDDDRVENIRRVGEVAKLFMEAGVIVLTAFISPFRADRNNVRNMVDDDDFIEVYCNAAIDVCESRDVKGLYKKARQGEIKDFTGVNSPYETPDNPELTINSGIDAMDDCVASILDEIYKRNIIHKS